MVKRLNNGWIRDLNQETFGVFRWYEHPKRKIVASVVEGYIPSELNLRISDENYDNIEVRGSKSIIQNETDESIIAHVERALYRQQLNKKEVINMKRTIHVRGHKRIIKGQSLIKHGKYKKAGKIYKHNLRLDAKRKAKHIGAKYAGWRGDSRYSGKYKGWI